IGGCLTSGKDRTRPGRRRVNTRHVGQHADPDRLIGSLELRGSSYNGYGHGQTKYRFHGNLPPVNDCYAVDSLRRRVTDRTLTARLSLKTAAALTRGKDRNGPDLNSTRLREATR